MDALIGSGQLTAVLGVLVGIVAVLSPVLIVLIVLHYRHRKSVEVLATVRQLAEKGVPVPVELLQPREPGRRSGLRSDLSTALSTLGAGIGLMVFFYASGFLSFLWGVGALVAIVGAAQLVALWLTRKLPRGDAGHEG
jgi:hypothetical protein